MSHSESVLCYALLTPFLALALQFFVLNLFNLFGTPYVAPIRYIVLGVTGVFYLLAIPVVISRVARSVFAAYSIATFVMLAAYFLYEPNRPYIIKYVFQIFFVNLPLMLISLSIRDDDNLYEFAKRVSLAIALVTFIIGIIKLYGTIGGKLYSMTLAYYLLFPCIVITCQLFKRFNVYLFLSLILCVLLIILKGSRGPLACLFAYACMMTLSPRVVLSGDRRTNRITKMIILFLLALLLAFSQHLFGAINEFSKSIGIQSRTASIISGERNKARLPDQKNISQTESQLLGDDLENAPEVPIESLRPEQDVIYLAGREKLYRAVTSEIMKSKWMPLGLLGDRVVLKGTYAHNFILEVIAHFGLVIGIFLLLIFAIAMLRALVRSSEQQHKMLIMWISLGLVPIAFSGSYLENMHFWILVGIMIRVLWRPLTRVQRKKQLKP